MIHRPRRKDWTLPKGKLDRGETWETAALREVEEETGSEGRIMSFAGAIFYVPRRTPKIVLYWHMTLVREGPLDAGEEVDEVAWLTPAEALARLDHEPERRLVERAPPKNGARTAAPVGGPLAAELATLRAEHLRRVLALDEDGDVAGFGPALDLLGRAEDAVGRGEAEEARRLAAAARRMELLGLSEPELSLRAGALREQCRELAPWRRRAVRRLLSTAEKPRAEAVYLAAELRDEELETGAAPRREARGRVAAGLGALIGLLLLIPAGARWSELLAATASGALGGIVGSAAFRLFRRR